MKPLLLAVAALVAMLPNLAGAKPMTAPLVIDCPLRDMPFSAKSPLIDLLLSPAANAVLDRLAPGMLSKIPPRFMGTEPPTFTALLTLERLAEEGSLFDAGIEPEQLAAIDAELRRLPVTEADKRARCARYDNEVPDFALPRDKPRLLLFEKINGYKDTPSVEAANAAVRAMAERNGWAVAVTEKGGAINPRTLGQFDAVIWNNISGDVLTLSQRRALVSYLERGGGFVAIHGSAGDPVYFWDWFVDKLIGARFKGHPLKPQFQEARLVSNKTHPLARALPGEWRMTDEWYSFRTNPRAAGADVVLTLDESSYAPNDPVMGDLRMGDHPIAWTNCIGKGRMFYSAIGHLPESYSQPQHLILLESAIRWTMSKGVRCNR
jgi:type 1 glutamine amidotransferase